MWGVRGGRESYPAQSSDSKKKKPTISIHSHPSTTINHHKRTAKPTSQRVPWRASVASSVCPGRHTERSKSLLVSASLSRSTDVDAVCACDWETPESPRHTHTQHSMSLQYMWLSQRLITNMCISEVTCVCACVGSTSSELHLTWGRVLLPTQTPRGFSTAVASLLLL